MSDKANLYVVIGLSSNSVIESIMLDGYNADDVHYYIMCNYMQFKDQYPFIHKTTSDLISIYKKQYKMDPNLSNFKTLIDNSDELGNNFIKIIEFKQSSVINACSYYQNNKKTIALKPQTITIKDIQTSDQSQKVETKQPIELKQKTTDVSSLKTKIAIKKKTI